MRKKINKRLYNIAEIRNWKTVLDSSIAMYLDEMRLT